MTMIGSWSPAQGSWLYYCPLLYLSPSSLETSQDLAKEAKAGNPAEKGDTRLKICRPTILTSGK